MKGPEHNLKGLIFIMSQHLPLNENKYLENHGSQHPEVIFLRKFEGCSSPRDKKIWKKKIHAVLQMFKFSVKVNSLP